MKKPFSQYYSRSQLADFKYGTCTTCKETLVWAQHKSTLQMLPLDPKPVGGTEMDPSYQRHTCPKENDDE